MTSVASSASVTPDLLLGCWELVSWTRTKAEGRVTHPMGEQPSGRIIYDASGLMAAFLMHPVWPSTPDLRGASFLAYSGRYVLVGNVVEHTVDTASDRRFIGEVLRRRIVPAGEMIALETLPSIGRPPRDGSDRLLWQKRD